MSAAEPTTIDLETASPSEIRRYFRPAPQQRTVTRRSIDGTDLGQVDLDPSLFGIEPNLAVLHQVVTAQLAAARSGTQSTKTRAEVRGGGTKPFRQKGTGRARAGSSRSPIWVGGGVALGPKPRSYAQKTPKKMIQLALRSALSDRAAQGRVAVIDAWTFEVPSTKAAIAALAALGYRVGCSWCWATRTGTPTVRSGTCPRSRRSWLASSTPTTSWSTTGWCSPTRPFPGRDVRPPIRRPPQPETAAVDEAAGRRPPMRREAGS